MGRVSLFVDGGYFFKQGSQAALGEKLGRREIAFDAQRFIQDISRWLLELYQDDELLRTYWYDGASKGVPTPEHLEIGSLPFVKLRLGRINSAGQQKGVDTLIVRDLMVLSQERSIHRAVVLSGDEDLREGVVYAQERGVTVAVLGIEARGHRSQSAELVREADENLVLPTELVEQSLARKDLPLVGLLFPPAEAGTEESAALGYLAEAVAVATEYRDRATGPELAALIEHYPVVPGELDALMLSRAARAARVYALTPDQRRALRAAFWGTVKPPDGGG